MHAYCYYTIRMHEMWESAKLCISLFHHVIYFEYFRKTCAPNMADRVRYSDTDTCRTTHTKARTLTRIMT